MVVCSWSLVIRPFGHMGDARCWVSPGMYSGVCGRVEEGHHACECRVAAGETGYGGEQLCKEKDVICDCSF